MRKFDFSRFRPSRRAIGCVQSLVIAALAVSAMLLAFGRAGFSLDGSISPYADALRGEAPSEREYSAAAQPLCVVATPEEGVHAAAMYSSRELEEFNARYSAALAEALGSAGEPEEVSLEAWEQAVSGPGVYFDYYTDCQLSSFAIWLGSEMDSSAAGHSARRLCLSLSDGEVTLYYMRERSHRAAYRCTTELSYSELAGRISESEPDGARFVFELAPEFDGVDPYFVVVSEPVEVHALTAENSMSRVSEQQLLAVLGMNSNLVRDYPEADGSLVYVEGEATLRLGFDGVLRYTNRSALEGSSPISPSDAVELTRRILAGSAGLESGVAELRLSYIYLDGSTGEYTLRYDYVVDGLPVSLAGREYAAEFKLSGGVLTSADIAFRGYGYTGAAERPLPSRLNAAVVRASGGGEPRLCYLDASGAVSACWLTI